VVAREGRENGDCRRKGTKYDENLLPLPEKKGKNKRKYRPSLTRPYKRGGTKAAASSPAPCKKEKRNRIEKLSSQSSVASTKLLKKKEGRRKNPL